MNTYLIAAFALIALFAAQPAQANLTEDVASLTCDKLAEAHKNVKAAVEKVAAEKGEAVVWEGADDCKPLYAAASDCDSQRAFFKCVAEKEAQN